MSTVQLIHEEFKCSKLGMQVIITQMLFSPMTDPEIEALPEAIAVDCGDKTRCGVIPEGGSASSYDWGKCSHPALANTGKGFREKAMPEDPQAHG